MFCSFATECVPIQIQIPDSNAVSAVHSTDVVTSGLSASIPRRHRKRVNEVPAEELRREDMERKHSEQRDPSPSHSSSLSNGTGSDSNVNARRASASVHVELDEGLFELCGTPGYLAPEVLSVSMYDSHTGYGRPADVWAAGVLMFTLYAHVHATACAASL